MNIRALARLARLRMARRSLISLNLNRGAAQAIQGGLREAAVANRAMGAMGRGPLRPPVAGVAQQVRMSRTPLRAPVKIAGSVGVVPPAPVNMRKQLRQPGVQMAHRSYDVALGGSLGTTRAQAWKRAFLATAGQNPKVKSYLDTAKPYWDKTAGIRRSLGNAAFNLKYKYNAAGDPIRRFTDRQMVGGGLIGAGGVLAYRRRQQQQRRRNPYGMGQW